MTVHCFPLKLPEAVGRMAVAVASKLEATNSKSEGRVQRVEVQRSEHSAPDEDLPNLRLTNSDDFPKKAQAIEREPFGSLTFALPSDFEFCALGFQSRSFIG